MSVTPTQKIQHAKEVCAFLTRNLFYVSPLEVIGQTEVEESVWYEMKLRNNDKLLIGFIYRSPNSALENNARLNKMSIDVVRLITFTYVLIGDDFNYPGINWQNETTARCNVHPGTLFFESIQEPFLYEHVQ